MIADDQKFFSWNTQAVPISHSFSRKGGGTEVILVGGVMLPFLLPSNIFPGSWKFQRVQLNLIEFSGLNN